ncbi:unnamed protein product [Zymoseptoria tritici ST99CH_1E4]|uniref:Rad21/Rec8-like protein N-terminal domain-containing protein n=1 Tax=Zymoseptoria tritici ST99CH_1E4 TaxID=1276532 RepID=A0A2H1FL55_ZYMTR|nr:unnamed protein product [Zymoseptoria tritici ST99CH_1E4]
MFYSHEVLTSRKYGVATVWLVATLGAKSGLKKVSRKAILDVDVAKACDTIVTPEAPMALRLQSNLLIGVTRVYSQQCGYILHDAENAKHNMRAVFKLLEQSNLEPEGVNKGKAKNLVQEDDPNFIPGMDLLDLDQVNFDQMDVEDGAQSLLSPHNSQTTNRSQQSIGGLMLPPSQSSFAGGPVGGGFGSFGITGDSGRGSKIRSTQPAQLLDDEPMWTVNNDGTMSFDDDLGGVQQPQSPARQIDRGQPSVHGSQQHSDRLGNDLPNLPDDDGFMPIQDDFDPVIGGQPNDGQVHVQHTTSSETATAPLRRKHKAPPRVIAIDNQTVLGNRVLAHWSDTYLESMREAAVRKQGPKLAAIAKKNAEQWMLGAGNLLGQGMRGPLDLFSGARLLQAFTGVDLLSSGQKRARDDEDSHSEAGRRVRSRTGPSSDELGRGMEDDMMIMDYEDDTIEQGREAPTPLDERHISSLLPWNQSAGSRRPSNNQQPTSTSMAGGFGMQLNSMGRRGSRLTSASPLIGRGAVGAEGDDFQLLGADDGNDITGMTGDEEFELFGPAAQVDTQTAAQSQWQRATLVGESANFLDFVRSAIEDLDDSRRRVAEEVGEDGASFGTIDFEELLPKNSNSNVVAAQGFLHALTLGTRNMLKLGQEEPFGAITMEVIVV